MVQSVELLLAEEDERRVREVWQRLLEAGLPSKARHTAPSNRPHTTLVAVPAVSPDSETRLGDAVAGRLPVAGRWGPVHRFGRGPWVLVRLVEPSEAMRALQAAVASVCDVPPDSTSAPARWRPHVTLARRVTADRWPAVLAHVSDAVERTAPEGSEVTATVVRRWDGDAHREWPLTRPE